MQLLVDQPLYNQKIYKGYSVGTYGPVPSQPANSFVSPLVKSNPYPYNPSKAISLLKTTAGRWSPTGPPPASRPVAVPTSAVPEFRRVPNWPSASNTPADWTPPPSS